MILFKIILLISEYHDHKECIVSRALSPIIRLGKLNGIFFFFDLGLLILSTH